jgi:hypothetical protein
MKKKSPMQLSLDYLAKLGYACQIVERRLPIPGRFVTQDCFGFADILAYKPGVGIVLVQTTSAANFTARAKKVANSPHSGPWCRAGGKIFLHGWGKEGLREVDWQPAVR